MIVVNDCPPSAKRPTCGADCFSEELVGVPIIRKHCADPCTGEMTCKDQLKALRAELAMLNGTSAGPGHSPFVRSVSRGDRNMQFFGEAELNKRRLSLENRILGLERICGEPADPCGNRGLGRKASKWRVRTQSGYWQ